MGSVSAGGPLLAECSFGPVEPIRSLPSVPLRGWQGVENGKANRFRARSEDKMEQTVGLQLDPRL